MTVLYLLENSPSTPAGGTDISSHHLASLLRQKGIRVIEWAPYRTRQIPYLYTSLFLLPYLVLKTLATAKREHTDLIHVQGKYLVPVGIITSWLLRIPVVVTVRDYVICCPIGLCLFDEIKRHGLFSFFFHEVPRFLITYHRDEILINRLIRMIALLRAWFVSKWLQFWVKRSDTVISVSTYVQSVLRSYGITSTVIHNCFNILKYRKVLGHRQSRISKANTILFVGKDSYGKGSDLFDALSKKEEFSKYRFIKLTTDRWTPYEQVLLAMRDALVTVVPSRWQEPFGRVALESLMMGTPVVATDRGGLPEIVENGKNSIIAEPMVSSLARSLRLAIQKNRDLRKTIDHDRAKLILGFSKLPVDYHIRLYQNLLGNLSGNIGRTA